MPETTGNTQAPTPAPEPTRGGSYVRHPETLELQLVEATEAAAPALRSDADGTTDEA